MIGKEISKMEPRPHGCKDRDRPHGFVGLFIWRLLFFLFLPLDFEHTIIFWNRVWLCFLFRLFLIVLLFPTVVSTIFPISGADMAVL